MREAKFRGKPINPNAIGTAKTTNGGWVYGYLSRGTIILPKNDTVPASCTYAHPLHIAWPDNDVYINCNVDPCTVGQFAGVSDENGTEIYEGDIVHRLINGEIEHTGVVAWNTTLNGFVIDELDGGRLLLISPGLSSRNEMNSYKIIGNIHDNPELVAAKTCGYFKEKEDSRTGKCSKTSN